MPAHKYTVGFFKKPQGVFTTERIHHIEEQLRSLANVELLTDLNYERAYLLNNTAYIDDQNLHELDLYFWHDTVYPTRWSADNYYLNVFSALERDCIIINSPSSIRAVNDKSAAHGLLKKQGIPVVDYALVDMNQMDILEKVFIDFGRDVVVKPRFTGWGLGIYRVQSFDQLRGIIEFIQATTRIPYHQIFLERFYENDLQKWTSVVVFGDTVFGYRKRIGELSDWKIYDPQKKDAKGQNTDSVELTDELRQYALLAKQAIGKDIIGFDFIYTEEGYRVVDENGRPGLYQHCLDAAHIDIEQAVLDLIVSKLPV